MQLPRIAKDFANYLELYEKYKRVYRVEEILDGTWEKVRASELAGAPFDEKLGVLSLLLSRLADSAREAYRLDGLTDALHQDLIYIREGEKTLGTILDEKQAALTRRRAAGSTDKDALFVAAREAERLARVPANARARKGTQGAGVRPAQGAVPNRRAGAGGRGG